MAFKDDIKSLRRNDSTLTTLNLSSKKLKNAEVRDLAEALKTNHTLTSLNLAQTKLTDEGMGYLAIALKTNQTLTMLNLCWNMNMGSPGIPEFVEALKTNHTLTSLELGYNHFSARHLADLLKSNQTLTSLNLTHNMHFWREGIGSLVEALKTNQTLTSLDLSSTLLKDAEVSCLAEALKTNHTLTSLNLGFNEFTNEGMGYLADALKTNQTLTTLEIMASNAGGAGFAGLNVMINEKLEANKALKLSPVEVESLPVSPRTENSFIPPTKNEPKVMAKALYSNQAENEGELNFTQGSLLEVLDESHGDWWKCRQNGHEGFVPANYLKKILLSPPSTKLPLNSLRNSNNAPELKPFSSSPNGLPVSPVPTVYKPVVPQQRPVVQLSSVLSSPSLTPPPLPSSPSAGRLNDAWKIKHADVRLEQQIGSGGCGVVYQGRWQGIKVAIKQLHGGLNKAALDEFQEEAQLAASLQHDHVVQLYGVTQEAPYYMVMKYMGKGSLYDVLRKEDVSWNTRVKFGLQIARGLSFLHDKGIIHRDVKSLNVLVSKKDDIKLSDFGLSKVKQSTRSVSKKSAADGSLGTLHWKAPELFKMGAKHTCASDIYSLGVLLWELSTSRLPYEEAEDESQIMAHVLGGNREELNPDAPPFLNELIERCWAQNPADRPSLVQVIEALKVGLSTLKGKPMSPQVSVDNLTSYTPPLLNSGDYRGAQPQPQQPFVDSGNYLRQGQESPVQGRGPGSPAPVFQSPVAPGQAGLWGTSQGRGAPLLSGNYRQAQSPVSKNNNNHPEPTQPRPQRKF